LCDGDGRTDCAAPECAASLGGDQGIPPELMAIWADSEVRDFALRRAADPDLAQEALLHAAIAVAQVKDLQAIKDLRAYFCRAVMNSVYRLRGQLAAARRHEPASLDQMGQRGAEPASPLLVAELAVSRLMAQARLERFLADRGRLRAGVPGRSPRPDLYRDLITAVGEHVLRATVAGALSEADSNAALQAAFPAWFGRPGGADNTCHQRLSRARRDVQALLQAVVRRHELLP
jgi:hypothetical protein